MQIQPKSGQDSEEQEFYESLMERAKPRLARNKWQVIIGSIGVSIIISYLVYGYWVGLSVSHFTSIVIGAQFCSLWGAFLLTLGAVAKPSTLALMSMTKVSYNADLFVELMKSRFTAKVGIGFVFFGFLINGIVMMINEIITI